MVIGEGKVKISIGAAPNTRNHILPLPRTLVIGLTTQPWRVSKELRRWFVHYGLALYSAEEITEIALRLAQSRAMVMSGEIAEVLATHAGGSPGNLAVLMTRAEQFCPSDLFASSKPESAAELLKALGLNSKTQARFLLAEQLQSMGGEEFENAVAELFRAQGYGVEMTPVTGDHGVDLILRRDGVQIAVQCKRWNGPVGEPMVRDFIGAMVNSSSVEGAIVTTARFTPQAIAMASSHRVRLIDMESLTRLIAESSPPSVRHDITTAIAGETD